MGSCPFQENRVDVRDVYVGTKGVIGDISWGISYRSEKFGLVSLNSSYVGLSTSPRLMCYRYFIPSVHVCGSYKKKPAGRWRGYSRLYRE